jgi:hypothetical protein
MCQVPIGVGFFKDDELQHTWSALLYWRERLIVPFMRFGALLAATKHPAHACTHFPEPQRCTAAVQ